MVKKTSSKRRGIERGVQRYKIRSNTVTGKVSSLMKILYNVGVDIKHVQVAARFSADYIRKACIFCCVVPVEESGGGHYKHMPRWRRIIHYALALLYLTLLFYRIYATMSLDIWGLDRGVFSVCLLNDSCGIRRHPLFRNNLDNNRSLGYAEQLRTSEKCNEWIIWKGTATTRKHPFVLKVDCNAVESTLRSTERGRI